METSTGADRTRIGTLPDEVHPHAPWEDALGIVCGIAVTALGLSLCAQAGLVSASTSGLAVLLHYVSPLSVGMAFFLINVPFYAFAWWSMGRAFALRSLVAVAGLSVMTDVTQDAFDVASIDPVLAALLVGLLLGYGSLSVFRHRATFGGAGIVALHLQRRFGFRAGLTLLIFDTLVLALALSVIEPRAVLVSLLSVAVLGAFVAVNHREDRYRA